MMTKLEELKLELDKADDARDKALDVRGKAYNAFTKFYDAFAEARDAYKAEQNRLNIGEIDGLRAELDKAKELLEIATCPDCGFKECTWCNEVAQLIGETAIIKRIE